MKKVKRRPTRNSLQLLIDSEIRQQSANNNAAESAPPVFQRVDFYENPGILMIVQSVGGEGKEGQQIVVDGGTLKDRDRKGGPLVCPALRPR